jgi:hypothetical protein
LPENFVRLSVEETGIIRRPGSQDFGFDLADLFLVSWLPDSFMPRFRKTIPVDDYVLDVLMRDIVGHDQKPAAYLVYLYLYALAVRQKWKPVAASLRELSEATGLSKSAVQTALELLRWRKLVSSVSDHPTAVPKHRVLRPWR